MTTNALLQKHNGILATIECDAEQTVREAQTQYNECKAEHEAAQQNLKGLKETMDSNHRGFFGAAKAILAMVHKRPSAPDEISDAILPIINYQAALAAVPAAEEACDSTFHAMADASVELNTATNLLRTFSSLRSSAENA